MSEPKLIEITLPIQGMNCNGCASNVERVLSTLPGVSAVKVDLKTNAAQVTYDPLKVDLLEFQYAVTQIGYGIPTEEITLSIGGMSCVSCSSHVGSALADLTGVLQANVNLDKATAVVTYVPQLVSIVEMESAVAKAGYQAVALSQGKSASNPVAAQVTENHHSTDNEKFIWRFNSPFKGK
ncbi:MAG: heavy-metal-associated domain-containing protein [Bellilinea sp.]